MMDAMRDEFPIQRMAILFGVSRRGYYSWERRKAKRQRRMQEEQELAEQIRDIQDSVFWSYGISRILPELVNRGIVIGHNRLARIMSENGLNARYPKPFRTTTISKGRRGENLLASAKMPDAPDQVWVSDITYIRTREGWRYLTVILDRWSRMIVGWAFSSRLTTEQTTIPALKMALSWRRPARKLIFHSDCGTQYCDRRLAKLLRMSGIIQSFAGSCYENAYAESFFKTLKTEVVEKSNLEDAEVMRDRIAFYMEIFYNRIRRHSALGNISPFQFEELSDQRGRKNVA